MNIEILQKATIQKIWKRNPKKITLLFVLFSFTFKSYVDTQINNIHRDLFWGKESLTLPIAYILMTLSICDAVLLKY